MSDRIRAYGGRLVIIGSFCGLFLITVSVALDFAGHERAGIDPESSVEEVNGRYYEVGRGGGPRLEDRYTREISREQYHTAKVYDSLSTWVGLPGILLFMGSLGTAIIGTVVLTVKHRPQ